MQPRNALVLDTNVLVAMFDVGERVKKNMATTLLETTDRDLIVLTSVLVEGWGVMANRNRDAALAIYDWVWSKQCQIEKHGLDGRVRDYLNAEGIDLVDATLADFAANFSDQFALTMPVPIATFDTKDFWRLRSRFPGLRVSTLNVETNEIE